MIITGDSYSCLATLPAESIQCVVTSPPYWGLRDYGVEGQLGLEKTPEEYVQKMVEVFREVRRVLKKDGTLWLNLGDSYTGPKGNNKGNLLKAAQISDGHVRENQNHRGARGETHPSVQMKTPMGLKPKDLVGVPWRIAFALQADGWFLRQDIIWHKPNPMPESVRDRCTKAHEYIFLLSKSPKYHFDYEAIKEPSVEFQKGRVRQRTKINGVSFEDTMKLKLPNECAVTEFRNKRSVWSVTTKSFKGAHFATFPPDLIEPCILAGARPNDLVLDPFAGAGTVGLVCKQLGREFIGIEINPEYVKIAETRLAVSP